MPTLSQFLDPHMLFLGVLLVHATIMFTLGMLALSDRRSQGTRWLAAAGVLQFVATAFRLSRGMNDPTHWDVPGATLLLATIFLNYMGLRWFAMRCPLKSSTWPVVLGAVTLMGLLLGYQHPFQALLVIRLATLVTLAVTIQMLEQARSLRGVARVVCFFTVILFLLVLARLGIVLHVGALDRSEFSIYAREATLIALTLMEFSFMAMFLAESNRRLHEETRLDVLTGLPNRRALEETAVQAVGMAEVTGRPLALMMLDLDRFKLLNDTYGHALGDRALRAVGEALLRVVGSEDCVGRLGGEEFAILLPGFPADAAAILAERVREAVAEIRIVDGGRLILTTVSIGVSCLRVGEKTWSQLLERADVALYRAKHEGRNRVVQCNQQHVMAAKQSSHRVWRKMLAGRGPML